MTSLRHIRDWQLGGIGRDGRLTRCVLATKHVRPQYVARIAPARRDLNRYAAITRGFAAPQPAAHGLRRHTAAPPHF